MTNPTQIDIGTPCACGAEMYISTIKLLGDGKDYVVHSFHCGKCSADREFNFAKIKK